METTTLKLRGMSCASCASSIERVVSNVSGVEQCNVNFGAEQATVTYNSRAVDVNKIQQAIADAGYSSQVLKVATVKRTESERQPPINK